MLRSSVLAAALSFFAVGCFGVAVDEDNYNEVALETGCKFAKKCNTYYFYLEYDDVDDCVNEQEDELEDAWDYFEDECDFDEDKAADCMALYNATCKEAADDEDYFEDCLEVWECPGA